MKKLLDFLYIVINTYILGFFFGLGIITAFGLVFLIVFNKILPIINKFIGTL